MVDKAGEDHKGDEKCVDCYVGKFYSSRLQPFDPRVTCSGCSKLAPFFGLFQ